MVEYENQLVDINLSDDIEAQNNVYILARFENRDDNGTSCASRRSIWATPGIVTSIEGCAYWDNKGKL